MITTKPIINITNYHIMEGTTILTIILGLIVVYIFIGGIVGAIRRFKKGNTLSAVGYIIVAIAGAIFGYVYLPYVYADDMQSPEIKSFLLAFLWFGTLLKAAPSILNLCKSIKTRNYSDLKYALLHIAICIVITLWFIYD